MSKNVSMKETQIFSTIQTEAEAIGWDLTLTEIEWATKTFFAGITDFLAISKNKKVPVVLIIQDVKGNNVGFAGVKFDVAEDEDEDAGSWEYFWSFNMSDMPENATPYVIENDHVLKIIAKRGYNLCKLTVGGALNYLAIFTVMALNVIKDTLDQQDVAVGEEFTIDLPGYFEVSVAVENDEKVFSIAPKEEMKVLIKEDHATEK